MKRLFAFMLVLVLLIGAASAETLITVSGHGQALVNADTAVVTLGVRKTCAEVKEAQGQVNSAIAAIRAALIEADVKAEDINTDSIKIYSQYDYSSGTEMIVGYTTYSYLAVKTTDMDSIGTIIDIALDAGANTLDSIVFSASDTSEIEDATLAEAVKDARHNAEIIAAAAGLEIIQRKSIGEGSTYSYDSGSNYFQSKSDIVTAEAAEAEYDNTVVQAAKLLISSEITVVFTAE